MTNGGGGGRGEQKKDFFLHVFFLGIRNEEEGKWGVTTKGRGREEGGQLDVQVVT